MLQLGQRQKLKVVKSVDFGVYLAEGEQDGGRVLLPKKQVPEGIRIGDEIEVFLYKDSKDRPIATTHEPKLMMGQVALLKVAAVQPIGAFLDWGLEKELFLPFRQQTRRLSEGDEVLVSLYVDKSSRLCATMKVYPYLLTESPYQKDDQVTGRIYEISDQFGAFVAVDDKYSALLARKEMYGTLEVGMLLTARVAGVKQDGKLDLSIRQKAHLQMGKDSERILEVMRAQGGFLPFTDKASPERIRSEMGMSKAEFKRAVGHLLKNKKIKITEDTIRLAQFTDRPS